MKASASVSDINVNPPEVKYSRTEADVKIIVETEEWGMGTIFLMNCSSSFLDRWIKPIDFHSLFQNSMFLDNGTTEKQL